MATGTTMSAAGVPVPPAAAPEPDPAPAGPASAVRIRGIARSAVRATWRAEAIVTRVARSSGPMAGANAIASTAATRLTVARDAIDRSRADHAPRLRTRPTSGARSGTRTALSPTAAAKIRATEIGTR